MDDKYNIPDNPEYNQEMRKLKDDDWASATQTFNPLFEQMIENTAAVKEQSEKFVAELEETIGELEKNIGGMEETKGQPGGLATLDEDGKISVEQLPAMDYDEAGAAAAVQSGLDSHKEDKNNPHTVTKAQVGLGSVNNTSDTSKPVSTAQKAAIDAVEVKVTAHEANVSNPHQVTASQTGAIPVSQKAVANGVATLGSDGKVPAGQLPEMDYDAKGAAAAVQTKLTAHESNSSNPHKVTAAQVNAIATSAKGTAGGVASLGADGKVPAAQLPAMDYEAKGAAAVVQNDLNAHKGDGNAHVTAAKQTKWDTHEASKSNPHTVTKAQVGLGNVDNTSDANKPVSTAAKTAIDIVGNAAANAQITATSAYGRANAAYDLAASGTDLTALNPVVMGSGVTVSTPNNVAIGINAKVGATAVNSIVIGVAANANNNASVSIGANNHIDGASSVSFGSNIAAKGEGSIVIGHRSRTNGANSIAIGTYADAGYSESPAPSSKISTIAIGHSAVTEGNYAVSIGFVTKANGMRSVAIGANAWALRDNSVAIGNGAYAGGYNAMALGRNARASGSNSSAIGYNAYTDVNNSVRIGSANSTEYSALYSLRNITTSSDVRDKADIQPVEKALDFLNSLKAIQYVDNARMAYLPEELTEEQEALRDNYAMHKDLYDTEAHAAGERKGQRKRVGVSAQEVQAKMLAAYGTDNYAELVHDNLYDRKAEGEEFPDGVEELLSVNYTSFIPFLIKAIQELMEKLDEVIGRIEKLEAKQ